MEKDISDEYKLMCAKAYELQQDYHPSIGDYIITKASYCGDWNSNCTNDKPCDECLVADNIYVIDNKYDYAESVGGTCWFFDSQLCVKDGGHFCNDTCCAIINKSGKKNPWGLYDIYPLNKFLWIPKLNQLIRILTVIKFYDFFVRSDGYIDDYDNDLEINTLMYLMKEKYNKYWNATTKQWQ